MLRNEVEHYTKLTGEDGWHVPIMKVGAYLDGYDKGLEMLDEIRAEIEKQEKWLLQAGCSTHNVNIAFDSIKSALVESEGKK